MKKVFFKEEDWNDLVMYLRSKNIAWENESYFQFDPLTAAIMFIAGVILGAVITSVI